jgi:hypothetical protein
MFAQMKSRQPSKPCPCNNTCLCHKSQGETWEVWLLCFIGLAVLIVFPYLMYQVGHHQPREQHIEVNGQDCIVMKKIDGVGSTGNPYGHDIAVCPVK